MAHPTTAPTAEILKLVAAGWSDRKIAEKYAVTREAVKRRRLSHGVKRNATQPHICPRKGYALARDPELRVDCQNLVIRSKTGPSKICCSKKCTRAFYRQLKSGYLARLKAEWWVNLPETEKAKVRSRQTAWRRKHRRRLARKKRAWRATLSSAQVDALNQRSKQWREKQKLLISQIPILKEQLRLALASTALPSVKSTNNKAGRKKGMTPQRIEEAQLLEGYIQQFQQQFGSKRGAVEHAARKVYGVTGDLHKKIRRANQTLRFFRKGKMRQKTPA